MINRIKTVHSILITIHKYLVVLIYSYIHRYILYPCDTHNQQPLYQLNVNEFPLSGQRRNSLWHPSHIYNGKCSIKSGSQPGLSLSDCFQLFIAIQVLYRICWRQYKIAHKQILFPLPYSLFSNRMLVVILISTYVRAPRLHLPPTRCIDFYQAKLYLWQIRLP